MKILQTFIWLLFCVWLLGPTPVMAQSTTPPDSNREALESLLKDLENTIEEADKRMVAHPRFIEELRNLVARYKTRLREVFLYEDFSDGDYTKSPKWTIRSGQFRITPDHRLLSSVFASRPSQASSSKEEEEPLELLLREIIRSADKKRRDKPPARTEEDAIIRTLIRIGPAFEVDISFLSKSSWGEMEIVLVGGNPPTPRYRMIYHAAPSQNRPIEIVRERGSRRYTIESATRFPNLDDGSLHRLQWIRDNRGRMKVLVDGQEILSTVELFYRGDFAGLELVNSGGTYEWRAIKILQALVPTEP